MRPAGIARATKDNSGKHPQQAEEFREGKKIGRPKQRWIWDIEPTDTLHPEFVAGGIGHWEKVKGATNG